MATVDFFSNYFTRENLAHVLLKTPYIPGRLGELGLFKTVGLTSTKFDVEELPINDVTPLSGMIPRGSPLSVLTLDSRKMHPFETETWGAQGTVLADEVLNVRAYGSAVPEVVSERVTLLIEKLRRQADLQFEAMRMTVLKNPTNIIGSVGSTQVIAIQTDATKLRQELFTKLQLPMESVLKGIPYSGIRVLCSNGYWSDLIENKWLKDTYLATAAASALRSQSFVDEIRVANITFERYRGIGTVDLTANTAIAYPEGVSDLFIQAFAPDDTLSSVGMGAMGVPYYLRSALLDDDKGWRLTLQSHPKMVCTRPEVIIPITKS